MWEVPAQKRVAGRRRVSIRFRIDPRTVAEDGDPLDALLLTDEPAFAGCLVECRFLGVIEAEQTEKGKTERNNQLIAVAAESHMHASLRSLSKLEPKLLDEIEHFFASYNEARGKQFKPLARKGPGVGQTIDRKVTAETEAALRRSSTP